MVTAKKRKLSSDPHDIESAKRLKISGQEITFLNGNPYPDNFHVGQAIGDGSCFFDSFKQGLEQQKGIKVTVEQLRNDCKEFAQKNQLEWFTNAIVNSYDNNGQRRSETVDDYQANIMNDSRWGDPEVEGKILCEKYSVKLHVVESNPLHADDNQQDPFLHQLIDGAGSKNAGEYNKVDYDDNGVLHMINKGHAHFEPLLDINKSSTRQIREQQEQNDLSLAREIQEQEDFRLAKELQIDEILEYFNIPKDSPKRKEVEERFDELLKENPEGKIHDVVGQCVSDIKQRIERSEEQNPSSLPRCSMEEPRVMSVHQQQLVK